MPENSFFKILYKITEIGNFNIDFIFCICYLGKGKGILTKLVSTLIFISCHTVAKKTNLLYR